MIRTFLDSGPLPDGRGSAPNRAATIGSGLRVFDKSNAVWFREVGKIEAAAQTEAVKAGLGAMDALHLAAAHLSHAGEFITTEKPAKPIHRSSLVKVLYLFA